MMYRNRATITAIALGFGIISGPAHAQQLTGVSLGSGEKGIVCVDSIGDIFVSGDDDSCDVVDSQASKGFRIGGILLDENTSKATFNGPVDINGTLQASGLQAFSGTTAFNSTVSFVGPSVTFNSPATFQNSLTAASGATINFGGNRIQGVGNGVISATSQDAINGRQINSILIAQGNRDDGQDSSIAALSLAIAENAYIDINSTGPAATATGVDAIAIGEQTTAAGDRSVAIGSFNDRSNRDTVAAGGYSVAMGPGAQTSSAGAFGVAIGPTSTASAEGAIAIGGMATASATGSVAIGAGSVANQAGTVSVGKVGAERRIVNVAAGTAVTDAVNFGQLTGVQTTLQTNINTLSSTIGSQGAAIGALQTDTVTLFDLTDRLRGDVKDANEGVAMALAMDSPNVPAGAKFALSGGVGYFKNRAAFAAAISAAVGEMSSVSGGLGYGFDSKEVGARAGFQIAW